MTSTLFRRTIDGPLELFYADLYASAARPAAGGSLGMPGVRDQHTGCVGAYLVEHDLFDFMLFSLPDNDAWSHRNGPHAQVTSIAAADRQLERLMHAAGGAERVPRAVRSDRHLRSLAGAGRGADPARPGVRRLRCRDPERRALGGRRGRAQPGPALGDDLRARARPARERGRSGRSRPWPSSMALTSSLWLADPSAARPQSAARRGELRFAPGGDLEDGRGATWSVDGRPRHDPGRGPGRPVAVHRVPRRARRERGRRSVPDGGRRAAVGRARVTSSSIGAAPTTWAAAATGRCTARTRWARCCGAAPARTPAHAREQWSLRDIAPMVRDHFGIGAPGRIRSRLAGRRSAG